MRSFYQGACGILKISQAKDTVLATGKVEIGRIQPLGRSSGEMTLQMKNQILVPEVANILLKVLEVGEKRATPRVLGQGPGA